MMSSETEAWSFLLFYILIAAVLQTLSNQVYDYNVSVFAASHSFYSYLSSATLAMNNNLNISGFSMYDSDHGDDETNDINISGFSMYMDDDDIIGDDMDNREIDNEYIMGGDLTIIDDINLDMNINNDMNINDDDIDTYDINDDIKESDNIKHPVMFKNGINDLALLDYGDPATAAFATHTVTSTEWIDLIESNAWYQQNTKRKPKVIQNPVDRTGKTKLWEFSGDDWQYQEYMIPLDQDDIFEHVLDVCYDRKGSIKSIEALEDGTGYLNKLISDSIQFVENTPQIVLMSQSSPFVSIRKETVSYRFYCGHNAKSMCPTTAKAIVDINTGTVQFVPKGPCIHIPHIPAGIIRSDVDRKFGKDYGSNEFKNNLLENTDNECMKWGNYNHQLKSKNQAKTLKSRRNAVIGPGFVKEDPFHALITKLWVIKGYYRNLDLVQLNYRPGLEYHLLGFVHDLNVSIPAFNMYHQGMLENLRRLKRFVVGIDDWSNNIAQTGGIKPNATMYTIPNPNGGTSLTWAQSVAYNWSSDVFTIQFRGIMNALTHFGRCSVYIPVLKCDYYVGFFTPVLKIVCFDLTVKQYHVICLQFCEKQDNDMIIAEDELKKILPRSLIRICETHIDKNVANHYDGAPNLKTIICSVWYFCYNTLIWADWKYGVSLAFHLSNFSQDGIPIANGIWNIVDYQSYNQYDEKEIDNAMKSMFDKKTKNKLKKLYKKNLKKNQNLLNECSVPNTDQTEITIYPFPGNTEWFICLNITLSTVSFSKINATIDCLIDLDAMTWTPLLEHHLWMEQYLYRYYLQFPGHYSAIIYHRFLNDNVNNNMDTECAIRNQRQFVMPSISKHCLPEADKFVKAFHDDYMRDFRILLSLSRLGAGKEIQNDETAMALYAGYKKQLRDISDREKEISIKLNKLISSISGLLSRNYSRKGKLKWNKKDILESMTDYCWLEYQHDLFKNCNDDTKSRKLNKMLNGECFSKDDDDLSCIEGYIEYGLSLTEKNDARKFALDVEELFSDDDD